MLHCPLCGDSAVTYTGMHVVRWNPKERISCEVNEKTVKDRSAWRQLTEAGYQGSFPKKALQSSRARAMMTMLTAMMMMMMPL